MNDERVSDPFMTPASYLGLVAVTAAGSLARILYFFQLLHFPYGHDTAGLRLVREQDTEDRELDQRIGLLGPEGTLDAGESAC